MQASMAASPVPRTQTSPSSVAAGTINQAALMPIRPARIQSWTSFVSSTKRSAAWQVCLTIALDSFSNCSYAAAPGKEAQSEADT